MRARTYSSSGSLGLQYTAGEQQHSSKTLQPVHTPSSDSAETLQVKKCNSFGAVTFCYASMFGFCGAVVVVYVDRKSADFVVSRSR